MDEQFKKDLERFSDLNYESFRALAADPGLSKYQKIGFPDLYRAGQEGVIFEDILQKMNNLQKSEKAILDIGCGCSDLPHLLIAHCKRSHHKLVMVDSEEMLDQLPPKDATFDKVPGKFPLMPEFVNSSLGSFDAILVYSLSHYIFSDGGLYSFLDQAVRLLRPGGQLLLGDVPNVSKRKRFFASATGIEFHKKFMKTEAPPTMQIFEIEENKIDDGVMLSLFQRYRNFGFETYILPLPTNLSFANRREDLLIVRP